MCRVTGVWLCTARNAQFVKSLNATVIQGHSVLLHCGSLRTSGHVVKWIKNGVVGSLGDSPRFQVSVIRVVYYLYIWMVMLFCCI